MEAREDTRTRDRHRHMGPGGLSGLERSDEPTALHRTSPGLAVQLFDLSREVAHDRLPAQLHRPGRLRLPAAAAALAHRHGRRPRPTIGDVITRFGTWAKLGFRPTGHSPRRGLATSSKRAGNDRKEIAKQGGWADNSATMEGYFEDGDEWEDNALIGVL